MKSDGSPGSDDLTTSAGGTFQYDYVLNGILGEYLVEVLDGAAPGGVLLANHSFLDAPQFNVDEFSQCANDQSPSTDLDCPGGWINGTLNSNNSTT